MENPRLSSKEWGARAVLALVFVALGLLLYIVFSPLRPLLDRTTDYLGRIGLTAGLLVAVWLAGRNERLKPYRPVLRGLLIMAVAISLDWVFAIYLLEHVGLNSSTASGMALLKLNEFFIVATTVITLTLLSGGSLGSIYIQKGNLKLGLLEAGLLSACLRPAPPGWLDSCSKVRA